MAGTSIVAGQAEPALRARPPACRRQVQRGALRRHHGDAVRQRSRRDAPKIWRSPRISCRGSTPHGGTEMLPALKVALKDASPNDTSRLRQVVFLTDGAVGNEDAALRGDRQPCRPFAPVHRRHRLGAQQLFHAARGRARPRDLHRDRLRGAGARAHERALRQAREAGHGWAQGRMAQRDERRSLARSPPRSLCRRAGRALCQGERDERRAALVRHVRRQAVDGGVADLRRYRRRRGRQAVGPQQDRLARGQGSMAT